MLSLKEFISEYKSEQALIDIHSPLIPLLITGYKYPDVPLIKQSELEDALTKHSINFNSNKFPSSTNHCSFNALLHNLNTYIDMKNRKLLEYAYISIEIYCNYKKKHLDLNDPKIQLERELEEYKREQDKLLFNASR